MSRFTSFCGNAWFARRLVEPHTLTNTDIAVGRVIADRLGRGGFGNPTIQQIIDALGGAPGHRKSRGQVLRSIRALEANGLYRLSNRGGNQSGHRRPLTYEAIGLNGASPSLPAREGDGDRGGCLLRGTSAETLGQQGRDLDRVVKGT